MDIIPVFSNISSLPKQGGLGWVFSYFVSLCFIKKHNRMDSKTSSVRLQTKLLCSSKHHQTEVKVSSAEEQTNLVCSHSSYPSKKEKALLNSKCTIYEA